jgi:hypothetical protein
MRPAPRGRLPQGPAAGAARSRASRPRCPAARRRDAAAGELGSLAQRQGVRRCLPGGVRLALAGRGQERSTRAARPAARAGAFDAVVCWHHARGGEGAADLGRALAAACAQPAEFRFLYPLELSIKARALCRSGLLPCVGYTMQLCTCAACTRSTPPVEVRSSVRACAADQPCALEHACSRPVLPVSAGLKTRGARFVGLWSGVNNTA